MHFLLGKLGILVQMLVGLRQRRQLLRSGLSEIGSSGRALRGERQGSGSKDK
jgi:hypothetical protein